MRRAIAALLLTLLAAPAFAADKPNIVLIMSDDMGYSDLGCYGGEIATPHLDRLGTGGIRFTRFYVNNMCWPTRASVLTGCYNTTALNGGNLSTRCVTIAEALRGAGYRTMMAGKWHLSKGGDRAGWPNGRGFDRFYGTIMGASDFFAPVGLQLDGKDAEHEWKDPAKTYYYTDTISDRTVEFINEAVDKKQPFFAYVAYTSAHWPLHALPDDIASYKGKYAMGWDAMRKQRHAKMKQLGVVNPDWKLSPRHASVQAWDDVPAEQKAWQQRRMEVYAAQVESMDRGIGRIVKAIADAGQLDNTLILFHVDNGGCHVEYTTKRKGPFLLEKTVDGRPIKAGNIPGLMPGGQETFQSYGYGWANASNTPFRLFKQHDHEGGILVPLIAYWPKVIKPNMIDGQVAHAIDIMPTALEVAGAEYPTTFKGNKIVPYEGKSLLPVLRGQRRAPHAFLFWKHAKGRAVRAGRYKLVSANRGAWELYDIEADGTELNNLAKAMPDKVKELSTAWTAWHKRTTGK